MSKNKRSGNQQPPETISLGLSASGNNQEASNATVELDNISNLSKTTDWKKKLLYPIAGLALVFLIGMGVMAKNGWLPATDAMTGKKTGWFGKALPANASSSWNPVAAVNPTPTPQLSKEYIYAGSRMLAVEDANANPVPPADLAVWRPGTGVWWVMGGQGSQQIGVQWGGSSDTPAPGDYDGDGKTDFCVYRPSTGYWYQVMSGSNDTATTGFQFGTSEDKPVTADYDGDGKTDIAIYRPSNGTWYVLRSTDGSLYFQQLGISTDVPVPADYDGDGKADFTVYRGGTAFYTINSSEGASAQWKAITFGQPGDVAVPADYDGDGKANYALKRGSDWLILNSALTQYSTVNWNQPGTVPVQNDYDGDGKVDIAVWSNTNGDWYIRKSSQNGQLRQEHWGQTDDKPVPSFFRR